jgi:dihydroorotate dehydrogenase electron transfer subunit
MERLFESTGRVVSNKQVEEDFWLMEVHCPEIADIIRPGQFVHVAVSKDYDPLFRRPFSVYRIAKDRESIEIFYKVVGRGTTIMTLWAKGHEFQVLGPLGNGFDIPAEAQTVAVVGRGIGIAPLGALVEDYLSKGKKVYAFLSAKNSKHLEAFALFKTAGIEVYLQSDDGKYGHGSLVTNYLEQVLENHKIDRVYICGSKRLTKACHNLSVRYGMKAQVALEQYMSCGIGACKGCVVDLYKDETRTEKFSGSAK